MPDNINNRRKHYRTRYPVGGRPILTISDISYEVIDISEGGLRLFYKEKSGLAEGSTIQGTITFVESDPLEIEGTVISVGREVVIIQFLKEIPFQTLFEQQKYIKTNFPEYFSNPE